MCSTCLDKILLVSRRSMKLAYIWMTRNLVNIMSGNCKRQNIWFPTLKLTRENMAQRNQYHSFFYNLLNHFLFLKNKFAFFESAVVSWSYLMSMNLNQAHFRLFVAVIILQKILRTKSVLPDTYNFQTAHSTLACLNSKLKGHFWVIFKILPCKNTSNLTILFKCRNIWQH